MKKYRLCVMLFVLFFVVGVMPDAAAMENFEYDGLKKCKGCHKSQYKSWRQTGHAKAFESLEAGVKAEAKEKAGLDPDQDYTADEKCVACHVTGYGQEGGYEVADPSKFLVGVGCESCHGPGKKYRRLHREAADKYKKKGEAMPRQALVDKGEEFEFIDRCNACHLNYQGSSWAGVKEPYTPFTPEVDTKYTFDFEKYVRNEKAMHQHFKLEGVFTGPPLPPFHQEFQDTAKPTGGE